MEQQHSCSTAKEQPINKTSRSILEAFPVDDGGTRLVVLLLGDPHLLEGGERSQDGSSDPDGVFPLGRSNDLDLHGGGSKGGDLLLHSVTNTGVHGGSAREDGVGVQILPDVDIALHDGVVGVLVDSGDLKTNEGGLEECLGSPESLVSDSDDLSVGELVGLLEGAGAGGGLHLLLEVEGDVAQLLFDVPDDFPLGGGGEGVTSLGQDLGEVVSQISASQIQTDNSVGESITFIDGDGMGNTISRIQDDTSGSSRSIQGEDSLDGNVHSRAVEGLEHDLGHLFSVSLGVEGSFGQKNGVFLRGNSQIVVEGVMPDFLHIIPVGDDSVLDGVLQGEDTSLALGLVSDVGVLLSHADHDTLMSGSSNDGREDSSGSGISGKAGLYHSGPIVHNQGSYIIIHGGWFGVC